MKIPSKKKVYIGREVFKDEVPDEKARSVGLIEKKKEAKEK